jgi:hypothetical protein
MNRSPVVWLEGLWRDVRHAGRVFARSPGFTAIAVISIAFGTGANVAMFSLADQLLLKPLPVVHPSELVTAGSRVQRGILTLNIASYPDYVRREIPRVCSLRFATWRGERTRACRPTTSRRWRPSTRRGPRASVPS